MNKKILLILLSFCGFSYADVPENASDFKCQQIINTIKSCTVNDNICRVRNISLAERYKICRDAKIEISNLDALQKDDVEYFNKLSYMPINTYIGLRKMIYTSLMSVTKNSEKLEQLKDIDKKELYKKLSKVYSDIQGKLSYIDKNKTIVTMNKNIPMSKDLDFISNENLLEVEEDVSVLMLFYDLVFMNYTSFRESHALIAEIYPNGVEGDLSISRTGVDSYSPFECTVLNRLLNFTNEPMLDLVYERACTIKIDNKEDDKPKKVYALSKFNNNH